MAQQMQTRTSSPARWMIAAERAIAEHIEVRQINANGMWTASSGSDPKIAYMLEIVAGVVRSCSCPAGVYGDPCCKHRAAFYHLAGLLDPEPPTPAAPVLALVPRHCPPCDSKGSLVKRSATFGTTYRVTCQACGGKGVARKEGPAKLAA